MTFKYGVVCIRISPSVLSDAIRPRAAARQTKTYRRLLTRKFLRSRKRAIRYSLLIANIGLLIGVLGFVIKGSGSSQVVHKNSAVATSSSAAADPLDQLSSADIAVNVARLTNLYETPSTTQKADSINAQLAVSPSSDTIVAKPQVVSTALKSIKDLQKYTTQPGDTVSSLAAKFGITSETIRWSNNLTGDSLPAGKELWISPIAGIVYTVQPGETVDSIAQKYHGNKDAVIAFNDAEVNGVKAGQVIVIPDGSKVSPVVAASTGFFSAGFAWGGGAIYGSNGYDYGYCTWYVANRRAEIGTPVPSNLGNAYSWYRVAQGAGLATGLTPKVGAVAVNTAGNHVSVVEAVNDDGSFWVSEMNSRGQISMSDSTGAGGWGHRDYKMFTTPGSLKFIY